MRTLKSLRRHVAKWFGLDELHVGDALGIMAIGITFLFAVWFLLFLIMGVYGQST